MDCFESQLKGRTYNSFVSSSYEHSLGGCFFVDNTSGYIHIEHQLEFLSSETIPTKQNYEYVLG